MCVVERGELQAVCVVQEQKKPEKACINVHLYFMKIKLLSEFEKPGLLLPLLGKKGVNPDVGPGGDPPPVLCDYSQEEPSGNG